MSSFDLDTALRQLLERTALHLTRYPMHEKYMRILGQLLRESDLTKRLGLYRRLRGRALCEDRLRKLLKIDFHLLERRLAAGHAEKVRDVLLRQMPRALLTPRVHDLLARAFEALGDHEAAAQERFLKGMCRDWIELTGDGSREAPFLPTCPMDVDDVVGDVDLLRLEVRDGERTLETVRDPNGDEVWFDLTEVFRLSARLTAA